MERDEFECTADMLQGIELAILCLFIDRRQIQRCIVKTIFKAQSQAIYHNLRNLRECGLLILTGRSYNANYKLTPKGQRFLQYLLSHYEHKDFANQYRPKYPLSHFRINKSNS